MKKKVKLAKCEAELKSDMCDRYNNAELTIILKIHLKQVNPAGGAASGTYRDYGKATTPQRRIVRWTPASWGRWKRRFTTSAEKFWHGRFWLINNHAATPSYRHCYDSPSMCLCHTSLDFEDQGVMYRPNIWCRFDLQVVGTAAEAHHSIDVVRLHQSEKWFGSHERLYDSRDIDRAHKRTDSQGKKVMQRAHVHEIGHLIGLPHVDVGKAHCPSTGNTNAGVCYGITDDDMNDVMGAGMQRKAWHAKPWRAGIVKITGAGTVGNVTDWVAVTKRHYPRTLDEVRQGKQITKRPQR